MKKRKKGDTLVELIAAIAILALASAGSSMAISVSSKMWQANSRNLELNTFNQSICEDLKLRDKESLNNLYEDNGGKTNSTITFWFCFDNLSIDAPYNVGKANLSTIMQDQNYNKYMLNKPKDNASNFISSVHMTDVNEHSDYNTTSYTIYKITVETSDSRTHKSSTSSFYIGG